ncbi:MAG: hypothetical protein E6H59_06935 [Betaproteobacteria bacterium]|nr:MAG: hypothetical protein E6H70_01445 [Betaproteobacteria bacterium]TMH44587.1 MAG: hypothetical protein E6H59_06935 [Betaproteobacteria bacterium]TMH73071.1 MAG: hypothetical protein E6H51_10620 [Betaproteobacteria bacterium]
MKRFTRYAIGATLVLGMSGAWAQQRDLEVTMDVVPANASAGAAGEIKLPLALPDTASLQGQAASAFGQRTATLARDKVDLSGQQFGQAVSDAARMRDKPTPPGKRP